MHRPLCEGVSEGEPHGDSVGGRESSFYIAEDLIFGIQELFILVMSGGKLQGKYHELKYVAWGAWKVVFLLSSVFFPTRQSFL